MFIAIQGWYLREPFTGIGQHTKGLIRAFLRRPEVKNGGLKLCVVVLETISLKKIGLEELPKEWLHVLPIKKWIPGMALKKWFWERWQVPAFFATQSVDWEWTPYPTPLPKKSKHARAVTVHDGILWRDARYQSSGLKGWLKRLYHKKSWESLRRVERIFAVSKTVREDLDLDMAQVIYNAVESHVEVPAKKSAGKNSDEKILLYLGGFDLRKRVPDLVEAFAHFRKKHPEFVLHLIGQAHHQSAIYPEIPEMDGVKRLGKLSDTEVDKALSTAFAFVHFSDSEGFNIPLLQAMSAGLPAVVRDIPVNREISQESALFFSREGEFFDRLEALMDLDLRQKVVGRQAEAAKSYSWDRAAQLFLESLKHV